MPRPLSVLLLAVAGACASPEVPLAAGDLDAARALAEEGRWKEARKALRRFEVEDFDLPTQVDYHLLAGSVADELGDWDEAIRHYEAFVLRSGVADQSLRVERRLLAMGDDLLEGRLRLLGFLPDRSRGVTTLENLAFSGQFAEVRAEALAVLAEWHFKRADYREAQVLYAELLRPAYDGLGWRDRAAYRLAACSYERVDPDKLSGDLVLQALDQFERYLESRPGGLYRAEAEQRRDQCREWLSAYHIMIGDFYRTVENLHGARFHYRLAAGEAPMGADRIQAYVQGTAAAEEARARLASLPPESETPGEVGREPSS